MHFQSALSGRVAAGDMSLDKPPDHIGWRGTLSLGKRVELPDDSFRKFDCGLHAVIVAWRA
jgi:hypothetical protein